MQTAMTNCCNDMTGQCEQGPGCPVREGPAHGVQWIATGMHTHNGGSAHVDTSMPIHFAGPEPGWWQRILRAIFGA